MKGRSILFFAICFPIFFQFITYYGFESSYNDYKNAVTPSEWYYKGIYGYRFLSREIVDVLHSFLQSVLSRDVPMKEYILKKGTAYYHSLFIFNTIFAVATSWMLYKLLSTKKFFGEINLKVLSLIIFGMAALSALSQFVILHYDNSAVFLLIVTAYFTLDYFHQPQSSKLWIVGLLIFVSTLNRETSCLNIAFFAALAFLQYPKNSEDWLKKVKLLIIPVVAFILPYLILRLMIPQEANENFYFFESVTLLQNFTGLNQIIGWLFGLVMLKFIYDLSLSSQNKRLINQFLLFSTPYILMIFVVGVMWEIRLVVPILYLSVIFATLNISIFNLKIDGKAANNKQTKVY